jgi:hypothetical protein
LVFRSEAQAEETNLQDDHRLVVYLVSLYDFVYHRDILSPTRIDRISQYIVQRRCLLALATQLIKSLIYRSICIDDARSQNFHEVLYHRTSQTAPSQNLHRFFVTTHVDLLLVAMS